MTNNLHSAMPCLPCATSAPGGAAGRTRFPRWLIKPAARAGKKHAVQRAIDDGRLRTVCKEARCPNSAECFAKGTATFLILGERCTRGCAFCAVTRGTPSELDNEEPARVGRAVRALGLRHVVITSVSRDDLADGGAAHFAATVRAVQQTAPSTRVEVLVPDFSGSAQALATVMASGPDVLNHNVETVPRLYGAIRPQADYRRSLELLSHAATLAPATVVKSGLMVGLGETDEEVAEVLRDLYNHRCSIVTIGQYLQPSAAQTAVKRFIPPEQFARYEAIGRDCGLPEVFSGPFIRSSYMASDIFNRLGHGLNSPTQSQTQPEHNRDTIVSTETQPCTTT